MRVFAAILILYVFCTITYHAGILLPILKWAGIIVLCLASLFGISAVSIVGVVALFFAYLDYLRESEPQEEPTEGEIPE